MWAEEATRTDLEIGRTEQRDEFGDEGRTDDGGGQPQVPSQVEQTERRLLLAGGRSSTGHRPTAAPSTCSFERGLLLTALSAFHSREPGVEGFGLGHVVERSRV